MTDKTHPDDLFGAYAVEACPPDEARLVAVHVGSCPKCAAEIAELSRVAGWIGMATATAPAPELRARVMSAALGARPAGRPTQNGQVSGGVGDSDEIRRLLEPYRAQIDELDGLLSKLAPSQWLLPTGSHRSVRDLVVHLGGNDGLVAAAAGINPAPLEYLPTTSEVRLGWRDQAHAIVDVAAREGPRLLERQVGLAGRPAMRGPMREALIQRGFETWVHADDVRATLRLPPKTPSAQQVDDIVTFALRLLPPAMDAAGRAHPDKSIRVVLTGLGGSTRQVNLSAARPTPATVVAEVSVPAERFCRLVAGRVTPSSARVAIDGDSSAANDFLTVAATLGCD